MRGYVEYLEEYAKFADESELDANGELTPEAAEAAWNGRFDGVDHDEH